MKKEKILVTGGAGFMGGWIAEALLKEGHEVAVVDDLSGGLKCNIPRKIIEKKLFFEFDLRNPKNEFIFEKFRPTVIYHLAANAREGESFFSPVNVTERNVLAYVYVLKTAIKYGMRKCVLFSSMAAYGDQEPPFSEDISNKPVDVYASNKAAMEEITKQLAGAHGFDWTIIVPHNVFGERQFLSDIKRNFIAICMNRIMRHESIYIYGDGNQKRAFSYIDNSLLCYAKCLDDNVNGEKINIGGIEPVTINYAAKVIMDYFSEYPKPEIIHLPPRHGEVKYAYVTCEKSQRLLGYEEKISFEGGIGLMAAWAKTIGPRPWKKEPCELVNEKIPVTWR